MNFIVNILKISLFWIFIQVTYLSVLIAHLIAYPYLRWVRKERYPFTYLGLSFWQRLLKIRIRHLNEANRDKIRSLKRCIVLSNHRSWADFLLCNLTVKPGFSGYVSRAAVFFLLPIAFFWQILVEKNAVVFNRGGKPEKIKLRLYSKMAGFLRRGGFLLVFPEGHRYLGEGTLPLKRGVIRWAYRENQPCAVVLCHGSEKVINEKTMKIRRNVEVVCDYGAIYYPRDFSDEHEFFARISEDFKVGYKQLERVLMAEDKEHLK